MVSSSRLLGAGSLVIRTGFNISPSIYQLLLSGGRSCYIAFKAFLYTYAWQLARLMRWVKASVVGGSTSPRCFFWQNITYLHKDNQNSDFKEYMYTYNYIYTVSLFANHLVSLIHLPQNLAIKLNKYFVEWNSVSFPWPWRTFFPRPFPDLWQDKVKTCTWATLLIKPEFIFSMKQLEAKPRSLLKRRITFDDSGLSFD